MAAQAAATLVARGAVMGFLPADTDTSVLEEHLLETVFTCLADRDVAVDSLLHQGDWSLITLSAAVGRALEGSELSPMPAGEWPSLLETLGESLLGDLLGVSAASVRRYSAGLRSTPDEVAARLHVLALVVADLAGGYNDVGIRRWFGRARPQLDGRSPQQLLGPGWDPDGAEVLRIRQLAAGLVASGAS
jgi:hypothetical protein